MRAMRTDDEPKRPGGSTCRRLGAALWGQVCRVARALVQSSGAMSLLRVVVVVELCLLGVGVVRRMEISNDQALRASSIALDVLEARALGQEDASDAAHGGAVIVGVPPGEGEYDANEVPALRPRDVATIISDTSGDMEAALSVIENNGTTPPVRDDPDEGQEQAGNSEVDNLIRKGVAAMIAGDMRRCILSLEQASTIAPEYPALLYYYGMAYDKLLNPGKARDYYKRLYLMRDGAGKYFERAARRLTYGADTPAVLRGKLAFGPYKEQRTYDPEQGEKVTVLLPVMLAPGEEVRSDDILIRIECFELVNGRRIDFSREKAKAVWVNEVQTWENWEENVLVTYVVPPPDMGDFNSSGDAKYYGFVAKMYYKDEPMDCVSSPASLILHEQMLNSRRKGWGGGLLPDDGLDPYAEEAEPYADYNDTADEP